MLLSLFYVLRYCISIISILPSEGPTGTSSVPKTNYMLNLKNFTILDLKLFLDRARQNLKHCLKEESPIFNKFELRTYKLLYPYAVTPDLLNLQCNMRHIFINKQ